MCRTRKEVGIRTRGYKVGSREKKKESGVGTFF